MKKIYFLYALCCLPVFMQAQQKKYAPGQLIIELKSSQKISGQDIKNVMKRLGVKQQRYLGFKSFFSFTFDKHKNADSLIKILSASGIRAFKNEILPPASQAIIETSDEWNDMGYWNSDNMSIYPAKSNVDSVLAFLPPAYADNENETDEKVSFVHSELPRLTHYDMPPIDSTLSEDCLRGGFVDEANATVHGSLTAGVGYAKWNNADNATGFTGATCGMTNTNRPVIMNVADSGGAYLDAMITMLDKCYSYCDANPDKRLVISFSFTGSTMPQPIASQIDAQDKILLMHSAGNGNTLASDFEDAFQLNVMASEPDGDRAYFSNYGSNVDIAFQGYSMRGLSSSNDSATVGWAGTSASAPGAAGLLVTLWNLMPEKTASEMKAMLKDKLNTTHFIVQPDGSESVPALRLWYLLGNQIFDVVHTYSSPVDASVTPEIDFSSLVNDFTNTQTNRKFYVLKDNKWTELPDGIATLSELGSGTKEVKYTWTNSETTGSDGENTYSEIIRSFTVYHTKPVIDTGLTFCTGDSLKIKVLNPPDISSTDTMSIYMNSTDITSSFSYSDSTFTVNTSGTGSFVIKVKYYSKDGSGTADSTEYTMTSTDCSLPVNFVSFSATSDCSNIHLTWQTTGGKNNKGFFVEQSKDRVTFSDAGFVESNKNSGVQTYSYDIKDLNNGTYYLRLRQTDNDGKTSYSGIKAVSLNCRGGLTIFPNPAAATLFIKSADGKTLIQQIKIVDVNGKTIIAKSFNDISLAELDVSSLAKGMYLIQVDTGNKIVKEKFVKE